MNPDALPAVAAIAIAFGVGVHSTVGLWRDYHEIARFFTNPRSRIIGRAFVIVSAVVTIAAGYFGFLAVRRMLGFDALDWSPILSLAFSIPVLFVPAYLRRVWRSVGR
jgi:hypothetical protein